MRYVKPIVMNLSTRTRFAQGQDPLGCVSGPAAGSGFDSCGDGAVAGWACDVGATGGARVFCTDGGAAGVEGDCFNGTVVQYYCEAGTGGANDPRGCVAGPSFA